MAAGALALSAAFAPTGGAADTTGDFGADLNRLARARHVHCAFYRNYEIDADTGDRVMVEGHADALAHYQGISVARASARQIHTRMAGSRDVKVVRTPRYLHFIDDAGGFYQVTTIYGCLDHDERRGVCRTFGAAAMRHFDARVLVEPDLVFDRGRDLVEPGFCDHGFVEAVEAAQGGK
ncbi:MAG: hypothetical protein ACREJT_06060 [Myxococcota bacterium]